MQCAMQDMLQMPPSAAFGGTSPRKRGEGGFSRGLRPLDLLFHTA